MIIKSSVTNSQLLPYSVDTLLFIVTIVIVRNIKYVLKYQVFFLFVTAHTPQTGKTTYTVNSSPVPPVHVVLEIALQGS